MKCHWCGGNVEQPDGVSSRGGVLTAVWRCPWCLHTFVSNAERLFDKVPDKYMVKKDDPGGGVHIRYYF